ncbi:phosphate/phosphite/phosphonate ABC transporter substrate-binding protein [Geoalkalibacter sp.]|uniref:phosphate/phosphite/phosphonate ABC transporter substrate-binding protein n=1 Tax=Geoalkalibacter sp. TaxID=3041440 RepID=UPI00272E39BC|nr:phosphate/phosphite/phosphonate ABC transporter substrate-binding protein [Geoalkalibacter sp.]
MNEILPVRRGAWLRFLFPMMTLVLAVVLGGCEKAPSGPVYRIGYMNCNSEAETMHRFLPLTRYLEKELGVRFEAIPVDTQDFVERYEQGEFDFTHTNAILYVILKEEQNLELLATEKRGQYGSRTAGALVVRRDSDIQTLEDVRGKRLIFGPQLALQGYAAQYDLLLKAGIDPELDLAYYAIPHGSFKHEKVIYGAWFGAYDVAAAPVLDLEVMIAEGKIEADDFRVLAQSEVMPYCTFGAAPRVDPKLVDRFRQALLKLKPEDTVEMDGERIKVLNAALIDGFEQLLDSDYDINRDLLRRVNMPPYQEF